MARNSAIIKVLRKMLRHGPGARTVHFASKLTSDDIRSALSILPPSERCQLSEILITAPGACDRFRSFSPETVRVIFDSIPDTRLMRCMESQSSEETHQFLHLLPRQSRRRIRSLTAAPSFSTGARKSRGTFWSWFSPTI